MKAQSIRARLTWWYLGVLVVATLMLSVGSWWLLRRSIVDAADASLTARVDGVRRFIETMSNTTSPDEMQDEFREYAELTLGETLLEVRDASGLPLCRPTVPGWDALKIEPSPPGRPSRIVADRLSLGRPFRVVAAHLIVRDLGYDIVAAIPMGPAVDALQRFQWLLATLVPVVLTLSTAGGYWISRRALTPVDRMTRAVQAITVRHLDRRLDVPAAHDELQRLALTFNDMLARLQASVADMARLTAEASHELRTPVSLVRATAEVALGRERSADDYRQALAEVLEHAERLSNLVGDLLSLARADAGVEPQDTSVVGVSQLAREAAHDVQAAMARASLHFDLTVPDAPLEVDGQPESLRRLLMILLDNAMKYTPAGGSVHLAVMTPVGAGTGGEAVLQVGDTGIGIGPAELDHVFDRFYRGVAARQQWSDGSGLGLAIARTIVLRHGGSITLGPGPDGRGCLATVRLPLARSSGTPRG